MNPTQIALTMLPGLGCKSLRQLLDIYPNTDEIFALSHKQLKELFGTHNDIIHAIENKTTMAEAEKEVETLMQHGADTLFCTEPEYPQRLNQAGCEDTPALLYRMGKCDLNAKRSVAMVGSRKATDYGRTITSRLIQEMRTDNILVVSGLAYGIDTAAHKASVENRVPTVGVLGHGLDQLYPAQNRELAQRMIDQGGALITEYRTGTAINPAYFPARNRIVAAMSDATVVIEAAERGGALITANIANSYHREVFAVPGRLDDPYSAGCNNLIANNKALIIRNAGDILFQMGWRSSRKPSSQNSLQQELFATLSKEEQTIVDLLTQNREMTFDDFVTKSSFSHPKIASLLMDLELKKVIRCLPGRIYKII